MVEEEEEEEEESEVQRSALDMSSLESALSFKKDDDANTEKRKFKASQSFPCCQKSLKISVAGVRFGGPFSCLGGASNPKGNNHGQNPASSASQPQHPRDNLNTYTIGWFWVEHFRRASNPKGNSETPDSSASQPLIVRVTRGTVESERAGIKLAEDRNRGIKRVLNLDEEELISQLQEELNKETSFLEMANQEIISIQTKLEEYTSEFEDAQNLLCVKESQLVEARLRIQHLISERTSSQLTLQETDTDVLRARQIMGDPNLDVAELKRLLTSREEQLIQTSMVLQSELSDTKLKYSEAVSFVQRITDLTNKLVHSVKEAEDESREWYGVSASFLLGIQLPGMDRLLLKTVVKQMKISRREMKQLETELGMTKESLREKKMEFLAAQRALLVKDGKLETVSNRLDNKERELSKMKEEMLDDANGLRKLYELAQEETIGDEKTRMPNSSSTDLQSALSSAIDSESNRRRNNLSTMSNMEGTT